MDIYYRVLIAKAMEKIHLGFKKHYLCSSHCLLMKSRVSSHFNGYARWRIVRDVWISFHSRRCFLLISLIAVFRSIRSAFSHVLFPFMYNDMI